MLKIFGGKKVIGIDTFLPKTVLNAINKSKSLKRNISLINGSSTDEKTIKKIEKTRLRNSVNSYLLKFCTFERLIKYIKKPFNYGFLFQTKILIYRTITFLTSLEMH